MAVHIARRLASDSSEMKPRSGAAAQRVRVISRIELGTCGRARAPHRLTMPGGVSSLRDF